MTKKGFTHTKTTLKNTLKNTASFDNDLLERLKDPEFAQHYLEVAVDDYDKDSDAESLLIAMGDIAKAQGGIGKLAKRAGINREHLYDVLASRHKPSVDNFLHIVSGLGFRIRLERQEKESVGV